MRARRSVRVAGLLAAAALLGGAVAAGEGQAPAAPASEEQRILELGRPGPEHDGLAWRVGDWKGVVTYWPFPGAAPVETSATSKAAWVLDGRWVRMEFRSEVNGQPFEGIGFLGFDRMAGQYVSMWLDSMSTGVLTLTGTCEAACREMVLEGARVDPQTGREYGVRQVIRTLEGGAYATEFYDQLDDGSMFKSLEIRWERSSGGA